MLIWRFGLRGTLAVAVGLNLLAGVAALVLARYPGLSVAELKDRLLSSVDPLPSFEGLTVTGGRLNAAKALENGSVDQQ